MADLQRRLTMSPARFEPGTEIPLMRFSGCQTITPTQLMLLQVLQATVRRIAFDGTDEVRTFFLFRDDIGWCIMPLEVGPSDQLTRRNGYMSFHSFSPLLCG